MQKLALPHLEATRCVHAALPVASCQACVAACPRGAWKLGESSLRFDATACDACGVCAPACPQQAIRMPLTLEQRRVAETDALLVRCERSGDEGETASVPCLHRIGVHELLHQWREGRYVWLTRRGACERCERGRDDGLDSRIASLNAGLATNGLPRIVLREVSPEVWRELASGAAAAKPSRRGFFAALRKRPMMALNRREVAEETTVRPPGELLPEGYKGILPWHIRIDASRCVACHACVRVCPHGAIELADGEFPLYRLRHRLCTGCRLCLDACAHEAVAPVRWQQPDAMAIWLATHRCPACGQEFQAPAGQRARVCWVCASARTARPRRRVML
jgi:ferredoxin